MGTALILTIGLTSYASAGCNSIPDAESVLGIPPGRAGLIGFKGALGRVDRIHLLPSTNASFRIQPDGICVNHAGRPMPIVDSVSENLNIRKFAVSLVVRPANSNALQALVLATKEVCDLFSRAEKERAKGGPIFWRCHDTQVRTEERDGGRVNIRARLPGDGTPLFPSSDEPTPLSGAVTVIVSRNPGNLPDHENLLMRIAANGCAEMCEELMEAGALACVDKIYSLNDDGTYRSDPIPCAVGTAKVPKNNFAKQCENSPTASPSLAPCKNAADVLKSWRDECGGIHIPFDWTEIRKNNQGTAVVRLVDGRSGTSRDRAGGGERIWIPGREFLGSTPYNDPQGTSATTDWRFPDIDVWYPADSPESVGLIGTVDENDSIIHAFPRMQASIFCNDNDDEACMSVEGQYSGSGLNCACRDRYPASCTCNDLTPPRYFACAGGDFGGMPCTRHAHCNSTTGSQGGQCSQQPTCQPSDADGVWKAGRGHSAGHKCWNDGECSGIMRCLGEQSLSCTSDADCQGVGPCKESPWCGYQLFNLADRANSGVIGLSAKILQGVLPVGRGVCKGNSAKSCSNDPSNLKQCAAGDGNCTGYTLRAGQER